MPSYQCSVATTFAGLHSPPHCFPGLGTLPPAQLWVSEASLLGSEARGRCILKPDPTARVGRLWTQGRETWLQGQEFAFCIFQCPHPFRASIWQHHTICAQPLAKPRLSPTHTHILTLVRCTSVTEGMTPAWISSTYMTLSYSGKGPEVRRQHEPDTFKFKPALSSYLAENNDIGCITEKPGSAWPEHEMVLLVSRKEGTRPDL